MSEKSNVLNDVGMVLFGIAFSFGFLSALGGALASLGELDQETLDLRNNLLITCLSCLIICIFTFRFVTKPLQKNQTITKRYQP